MEQAEQKERATMAAAQKALDAKTAARRAYYKEWRRKHPDKVRAAQERFFAKLAAQKEGTKDDC